VEIILFLFGSTWFGWDFLLAGMDPEHTHIPPFYTKIKVTLTAIVIAGRQSNYTGMLVVSWFVRGKEGNMVWYGMVCSCMYTFAKGDCWIGIGSRAVICVYVCVWMDGWMDGGDLDGSFESEGYKCEIGIRQWGCEKGIGGQE